MNSLSLECPREMNEWLHIALCPSLPLVYSPYYLGLAAADYGDRAYFLACDYWRSGDRITASWCARVFKSHQALYRSLEVESLGLCPYCNFTADTDQGMAAHINGLHSDLEPIPVTAEDWMIDSWGPR